MKKIIRILAIIVVICLTCTCFTGCRFVDEMRESYAYYNENKEIVYNSAIYIALPISEEINFEYPVSDLYITDGEVPVLLSEILGEWCELSKNKVFISTESGRIYCRKDKYDSVTERIENGFEVTKYAYEYDEIDEDVSDLDIFYMPETKKYIFSKEELAAIDDIFKNVAPVLEADDDFSYNCDWRIDIYGYSEDEMFYKDGYAILIERNEYYIEEQDEYYNPIVRKVPKKYNKLFNKLTKKYIDSY